MDSAEGQSSLLVCCVLASQFLLKFYLKGVTFENAVCTEDGQIQLVGGSNNLEGRLEICFGGIWGTVCDDSWDTRDAEVVCRQLGHYITGAEVASFGEGDGPIYLDKVVCRGSEQRLISCPRPNPLGEHDCRHEEDAGVRCPAEGKK